MAKTRGWEKSFLELLRKGFSPTTACQAIEVGRSTVYELRKKDAAFRESWEAAKEQGADLIEDALLQRAVAGVTEPVFYQGEIVGHVKRYSDSAAFFLLKGLRPEKYRENMKVEHGGNIKVTDVRESLDRKLSGLVADLEEGEVPKVTH